MLITRLRLRLPLLPQAINTDQAAPFRCNVGPFDVTSDANPCEARTHVVGFLPSFADRRAADLMPVVLLVDAGAKGTMGVMLNRRTGVLMGDLGEDFKSFMIQVS